ncbi:hypothetical protein [Natronomonas sp. EA1]
MHFESTFCGAECAVAYLENGLESDGPDDLGDDLGGDLSTD